MISKSVYTKCPLDHSKFSTLSKNSTTRRQKGLLRLFPRLTFTDRENIIIQQQNSNQSHVNTLSDDQSSVVCLTIWIPVDPTCGDRLTGSNLTTTVCLRLGTRKSVAASIQRNNAHCYFDNEESELLSLLVLIVVVIVVLTVLYLIRLLINSGVLKR